MPCPTWSESRLVDLIFGGEIQPLRRAMNEIVTRRQPPFWIAAGQGAGSRIGAGESRPSAG